MAPTITRTTFTDDDGSNTVGTLWSAAVITAIYDQIDAVIAAEDALNNNAVCDGRLTLTSATPVTTSDVTGATNLYWSPYAGNRIALYDGSSKWTTLTFTEITQALGTLVNGQAYDVFAYNNAGAVALELLEWKNATVTVTIAAPGVVSWTAHGLATGQSFIFTTSGALPTGLSANTVYYVTLVDANSFKLSTSLANVGAATFITTSGTQSGTHTGHHPNARQTALVLQDGVLVKTGATTRRYLGTFATTATTTTEDSVTKRLVWNYYNRVTRSLLRNEATATWTYTTAAWRQANASTSNQFLVVIGVAEAPVRLRVLGAGSNSVGSVQYVVSIGEDSVSAPVANVQMQLVSPPAGIVGATTATVDRMPAIGLRCYAWLEYCSLATGTTTWHATGGVVYEQSGMNGTFEA